MDELPLLSLLILIPLAGAVLIGLLPRPGLARRVALGTALIDLLVAGLAVGHFDRAEVGFQLLQQAAWIPSINVQYLVGVDGLSILFLPLTTVLFTGVMVASWTRVRTSPRLYYSLLLLQQGTTLGVFCSLDSILFFLFWELSLVPLYFLISLWGVGPNRRYAATKYVLVMLAGGVPLLFGFVLLAFNHAAGTMDGIPAGLAFDLPTLLATALPPGVEMAVFLLLLLGFAVKTPLFPLHTWLPVVSMEGPAAITALLVGLKLGAYGLIRFAIPLAPQAAQELGGLLAALGAVGVLYGALGALAQTNLKRMLAYASLSHVGLVVVGIASFNLQGLQGAVLQLLNFTVAAGGVFLLTGLLHYRIGSTDIAQLGGAARTMPLLAGFFLLFVFAAIGVPGTSGFPAELLIVLSTFETHIGAGLAALVAMVIGSGYLLAAYRRTFFGPVTSVVVADALDLRSRELWLAVALALVILGVGLYPAVLLDLIGPSAADWVARLG